MRRRHYPGAKLRGAMTLALARMVTSGPRFICNAGLRVIVPLGLVFGFAFLTWLWRPVSVIPATAATCGEFFQRIRMTKMPPHYEPLTEAEQADWQLCRKKLGSQ